MPCNSDVSKMLLNISLSPREYTGNYGLHYLTLRCQAAPLGRKTLSLSFAKVACMVLKFPVGMTHLASKCPSSSKGLAPLVLPSLRTAAAHGLLQCRNDMLNSCPSIHDSQSCN